MSRIPLDRVRASDIITATDVQIFNTVGAATWIRPSTAKMFFVEVIGSGGGGGGAAVTGAGQWSFADGGGGGAYVAHWFAADDLPDTVAITIGAVGTGGSGANGTAGAGCSFGAYITAGGGGFGTFRTAGTSTFVPDTSTRAGGAVVTAPANSLQVPGEPGRLGLGITSTAAHGGDGGGTVYGTGGRGGIAANGNSGFGYGAGGGGAASLQSTGAARSGADGTAGAVIVTTYI